MKYCLNCKHANWDKTIAGKLHPSGHGICEYPWKMPQLPASMYWVGMFSPKPSGGYISRKEELKDHCAYFARQDVPVTDGKP